MKVMRVMKVVKVMANGTSLPFNWSPNSGQYVVEASRGSLDAIFTISVIRAGNMLNHLKE